VITYVSNDHRMTKQNQTQTGISRPSSCTSGFYYSLLTIHKIIANHHHK